MVSLMVVMASLQEFAWVRTGACAGTGSPARGRPAGPARRVPDSCRDARSRVEVELDEFGQRVGKMADTGEKVGDVLDRQRISTARRMRAQAEPPSPTRVTTPVYTRGRTQTPQRQHHIAFAVDTRADILRAADIAIDQNVFIETGPYKHAIQQTVFLYVYEPSGNHIELCDAGARLALAPGLATSELNRSRVSQRPGLLAGLEVLPQQGFRRRASTRPVPAQAASLLPGLPGVYSSDSCRWKQVLLVTWCRYRCRRHKIDLLGTCWSGPDGADLRPWPQWWAGVVDTGEDWPLPGPDCISHSVGRIRTSSQVVATAHVLLGSITSLLSWARLVVMAVEGVGWSFATSRSS
jgi:hypothetical protein